MFIKVVLVSFLISMVGACSHRGVIEVDVLPSFQGEYLRQGCVTPACQAGANDQIRENRRAEIYSRRADQRAAYDTARQSVYLGPDGAETSLKCEEFALHAWQACLRGLERGRAEAYRQERYRAREAARAEYERGRTIVGESPHRRYGGGYYYHRYW